MGLLLACARGPVVVESLAEPEVAALATSPASAPTSVYLVMVDRFASGRNANHGLVDMEDPQAWHGGDLAGVGEHLDWIEGLGVGAVWLTPVGESRQEDFGGWGAYHGYWPTGALAVEPRFGTLDDLQALQQGLAQRGLGLVVDLVWNHTGYDSPLLAEHPEWFHRAPSISNWDDPIEREEGQVHGLPDLDQDIPAVYDYLLESSRWWLEQSGATGMRLDAVGHMPAGFVQRIQQDLGEKRWSVGEIFEGSAPKLAAAWRETGLPAVFDFPLHHAMVDVLCKNASLGRLASVLSQDRFYEDATGLVTFLDNHDTPRIASACEGDLAKVESAVRFVLATRGVPSITWGTAVPLQGAEEPDNRADMKFEGNPALLGAIQEGLAMRADQPVFARGRTQTVVLTEDQLVLMRTLGREHAFVAINRAEATPLPMPESLAPVRLPGTQVSAWLPMPPEGEAADWVAAWEGKREVRFVGVPEGWQVVGSAPELGGWDPHRALEGIEASFPLGDVVSWKLVRVDGSGAVSWDGGENRTLWVKPGKGFLEVPL